MKYQPRTTHPKKGKKETVEFLRCETNNQNEQMDASNWPSPYTIPTQLRNSQTFNYPSPPKPSGLLHRKLWEESVNTPLSSLTCFKRKEANQSGEGGSGAIQSLRLTDLSLFMV